MLIMYNNRRMNEEIINIFYNLKQNILKGFDTKL